MNEDNRRVKQNGEKQRRGVLIRWGRESVDNVTRGKSWIILDVHSDGISGSRSRCNNSTTSITKLSRPLFASKSSKSCDAETKTISNVVDCVTCSLIGVATSNGTSSSIASSCLSGVNVVVTEGKVSKL